MLQVADAPDGMHAALSLLGRSFGLDHLPLPRGDSRSAPLLDIGAAVDGVCQSTAITAPVRLALLSHCSPRMDRAALKPLAMSVARPDHPHPHECAMDLLDRAYGTPAGADPLGRRSSAVRRTTDADAEPAAAQAIPEPALDVLTQDAQDAFVEVAPTCTATTQMIGGVPALSLSTTVMSRQPFAEARAMTDPMFWPECPPQSLFFKKMTMLDPGRTPLPAPDDGWSARILEVVDFSYGLDASDEAEMSTELDFVFFESELAAGCTYDLHHSQGREILVDRGFVMVEDLQSVDWRRTTTLKQVFFPSRANPGDVCRFWSLAHGMVSASCSTQRRPV